VNGGDKGGKELKYSSLETAFAELAFFDFAEIKL